MSFAGSTMALTPCMYERRHIVCKAIEARWFLRHILHTKNEHLEYGNRPHEWHPTTRTRLSDIKPRPLPGIPMSRLSNARRHAILSLLLPRMGRDFPHAMRLLG